MPTVVVYTDKGEQVWQSPVLAMTIDRLQCPGNTSGGTFAASVRRAVLIAEAMEEGIDPEEHLRKASRRRVVRVGLPPLPEERKDSP